jgi:hypothetical protein
LAAVIDEMTDVLTGDAVTAEVRRGVQPRHRPMPDETAAEMGIWLSGLESFLADPSQSEASLQLIRSVLERSIRLSVRLSTHEVGAVLERREIDELGGVLREAIQIARPLAQDNASGNGALRACCRVLLDRLHGAIAFQKLIAYAEACGDAYLPEPLKTFAAAPPKNEEEAQLALVLPRFGKILKWLSVVGRMLESDEPLKPALLVFARVNEQLTELIGYLNNRLERFPNEEAELFGALDAASYTASIELKKVYSPEFGDLISLRPPPAIYAGMETAYSMLNESFQQILTGLARIIDPSVDSASLFPASKANFEQSLVLRRELWDLVRLTKAAEREPEKRRVAELNDALSKFMGGTVRFLFYKDTDTFERFVEEILVPKQTKDLVPILHRFGAYLETLFGQVNLRAVFEKHPFEVN